jgi:hypothetical protein
MAMAAFLEQAAEAGMQLFQPSASVARASRTLPRKRWLTAIM